jgi:predicted phage terminase large subunit-like protein
MVFTTMFILPLMNTERIPLETFVKRCFYEISPCDPLYNNWHISLLCEVLEKVHKGEIKRLIICMPPRYLKSICVSTAFPAWVLGVSPSKRVIVASYAMPLAEKLSVDTKAIVESDWYKELFPGFTLHKSVNSKRKFLNSQGGFRLATSVNGSLTGEGADFLIADDPQKPLDMANKKYREKTHNWLLNTFFSRLNNKKNGAIIIVMQRLHIDDIIGRLTLNKLENCLIQECNDWSILNLAAIAEQDEPFRKTGEVLNSQTEDIHTIQRIHEQMGSYHFAAQYQQNPQNSGGGHLTESQIHFVNYDINELKNNGVFISIDTAFKTGINNDYTAISIWSETGNSVVLFDVICKKMEFNDTMSMLRSLFAQYFVHKMLIEDKGSGTSIIQSLHKEFSSKIEAIKPLKSKEVRFLTAISHLENGDVEIHENVHKEVIEQLLEFPNGKHDDAVDAVSQFIAWYFKIQKRVIIEPSIRSF